jgi:ATP-dependent exoDNAse (exonuclease V) beta subunit
LPVAAALPVNSADSAIRAAATAPAASAASAAEFTDTRSLADGLASRLRRQLGELAHAVLALLEEQSCEDPPAFVDAALASLGAAAASADLQALRGDLLYFLDSPLGRQIRKLPPAQRRHEISFVSTCEAAPHRVALRGQMDLLLWDAGQPMVVDFKYAHRRAADLDPYLAQLDAYAWAANRLAGSAAEVQTQLVFLRDRSPPLVHVATIARQQAVVDGLAELCRREVQGLMA